MAKWATKNLPEKDGRYLVTLKTSFGRQVRQADRSEYPKGNWYWSLLPSGTASDREVVAWQKQPEPYMGDCHARNNSLQTKMLQPGIHEQIQRNPA